ncbi:MAG: Mbeg1-like protein [Clostridiales bacterium]
MAKFNEKELLLLSNFMYISGSTDKAPLNKLLNVLESKLETDNVKNYLSGGIDVKEAKSIISEIKQNDKLINLESVESIDGDVRATCFIDPSDREAVLAFRGTGGIPEAWRDNLRGAYLKDTDMQKETKSFFEGIKDDYNIKVITGHSKGGNLSQYITVACDNEIERCVSFDGQGFGQKFHEAYKDKIEIAKDKITSISSFRDPVNGLLKPIAGETKYIKTESLSIPNSHKSTLLMPDKLFEKGNFSDKVITQKSNIVKFINDRVNNLENHMSPEGYKNFSDNLGNIAGIVMAGSNYKKSELMKEAFTKGLTKGNLKDDFKSKDLKVIENFKTEYKNLKEEINKIEPSYLNDKQYKEVDSFIDKIDKQYTMVELGQIKNSDLPKITENLKNTCSKVREINNKTELQKRTPLDKKVKQLKSEKDIDIDIDIDIDKNLNKVKDIKKEKDNIKKQDFIDKA